MPKKKQKVRIFVSSSCPPCAEIKSAVAAGRFNQEEVDLIDVETEEGFPFIKKIGLNKVPVAYKGKKECKLMIERETNSLLIDCESP